MKRVLLPEESEELHYYRANLHCHSTLSDGRKTVERLREDYMAHGYSIIAFTDHDVFLRHNDLSYGGFLALNGYEVEITEPAPKFEVAKCCHLCFIATDPDNDVPACLHRSRYTWGPATALAATMNWDAAGPDYVRVYDPGHINEMISTARKAGFFVTYNHPDWSLEGYPEYSEYTGMNAMEIRNGSCAVGTGYDADNGKAYEAMLRKGNRIFAVAADDNHNLHPDDSPQCDSYAGCVWIAAGKLEYRTVMQALTEGRFYASSGNYMNEGPRILGVTYDDESRTAEINTCGAVSIALLTDTRSFRNKNAPEGETLASETFRISPAVSWFRFVVTDSKGFKAFTSAFFVDR